MKKLILGTILVAAVASSATTLTPLAAEPTPVIVELFTSEGCSSCPPADAVLSYLLASQPVPGTQVIGLSEHVDYWDSLGWKDRFSSPLFSTRQSDYARTLKGNGPYTPQIIVNGRREVLGSDVGAVARAVADAARNDRTVRVELSVVLAKGAPEATITVSPLPGAPVGDLTLMLAVTEDHLATAVKRGENGGRTLAHSGVVRSLSRAASVRLANGPWNAHIPLRLDPSWPKPSLSVVAFVSDPRSLHIAGAGSARF